MKLKAQLVKFMQGEDGWVHGGNLERMEFPHPNGGNYKPSTVSRMMRTLAEEGRIKRETNNRGHVLYKYERNPYEELHRQMTL